VHQGVRFFDYHGGQPAKELSLNVPQLVGGPNNGGPCWAVKIFVADLPHGRMIMVASYRDELVVLESRDALIGVRPITDGVSKTPDYIEAAADVGVIHYGVQRLQIRVNVG
jgi:hypothetical protein